MTILDRLDDLEDFELDRRVALAGITLSDLDRRVMNILATCVEMSGPELRRRLKETHALYPALWRLTDHGLLERREDWSPEAVAERGGRPVYCYSLTSKGRVARAGDHFPHRGAK